MYDELEAAASVCEEVAAEFDRDPVDSVYKKTEEAARSLDASWSRSWAGYQARCYWRNFDPAEHSFSIEWGVRGAPPGASTFRPSGYVERDTAEVIAEIRKRAGVDDTPLREAANRAMATFASNKREILTTLDASLAGTPDAALREIRDKVVALEDGKAPELLLYSWQPRQVATRDPRFQYEGVQNPPHLQVLAEVMSLGSAAGHLRNLGELAKTAASYLRKKERGLKPEPVSIAVEPVPLPGRVEADRPWDLLVLGAFGVGVLAGRFGGAALDQVWVLVLRFAKGLRPVWQTAVLYGTEALALTVAGVAVNLVASQIDRDGRGALTVVLRSRRVRLLLLVGVLVTVLYQALTGQP